MRACLIALLFVFSAVAHAEAPEKYGADLPAGDVVSIATAVADLQAHAGKARKFSGRITDVCQKKGCWVMLESEGQAVRVLMGDHDFYIPKDVRGPAVVYGVLSRQQLGKEAAAHTAAESSDGKAVPEYEYRSVAEGVEVASTEAAG